MALTVDVEHDPLADRRRDAVGGDAHEWPHIFTLDAQKGQVLAAPFANCKEIDYDNDNHFCNQ